MKTNFVCLSVLSIIVTIVTNFVCLSVVVTIVRGSINKYPCVKTGGVAEGSWHYRRVLPSVTRHHTKFQTDS
jgi:hypothetical protein